MARPQKRFITRTMALLLAFLLFQGDFSLSQQDREKDRLKTSFRWAAMEYQAGKYREAVKNLQLLLSYFEEREEGKRKDIEHQDKELQGKIYLLLGAAYERLGDIHQARQNYRLSRELLENPEIEGINVGGLVEYQRIIMKKKKPVKRRIIEKPGFKPKKKRRSPVLIIVGVAVIGALVTAQLLNENKSRGDHETFTNPSYDTDQLYIQWRLVPAGEFIMGDNFYEGDTDELPLHTVSLDRYYISKYEVTFKQYDRFCEETNWVKPGDNGWGRENRPVINVTWGDASAFCNWLTRKTGKNIHLPTEAQWEKAARGIDQRRYPWGNSPKTCMKANYNCSSTTYVVGTTTKGDSPFGVSDMAGNVAEWCLDVYDPLYYFNSPGVNPLNSLPDPYVVGVDFVIRGGSWDGSQPITIRSADRWYGRYNMSQRNTPIGGLADKKSPTVGFRLVWEESY
ncbi:MAG: SUMF1/EgtB/PvdO family nonheme iron enzyme [Candidatus Aminicenantes bacterium]|nr:SUMF1/EgtB/PvdO family nonheme iron enzyme [Candidatus Aminicenantes bacterium]NIN42198.1 SUMF1/EgtB/PvdO family nonheme iron enzyme [Candidatus Aminicenantes bacterium]NIQ67012.1 SUMF1/EgtB/PvdO family nonheme iron enzyme [Candidatus Aminicenantes bacterium]